MVFINPLFNLQSDFFIKRCTALPGDTLLIENGLIKVNGLVQPVTDRSKLIRTDRDSRVNPDDSLFQWTRNNYGPLVIPRKGMTVPMDKYHCFLYEKTIRYFEKQPVDRKNDQYYIKDSAVIYYTFRHNYFFMMGDNKVGSSYCLDWGFFIPEENITGKAGIILYSYKKGKGFLWERLLKNHN